MTAEELPESEMRFKYFDWCSAQVADRFLRLSPEEIFRLAERGGHEGVGPSELHDTAAAGANSPAAFALWRQLVPGRGMDGAAGGTANYQGIVSQLTELLAADLSLPSFDDWVLAYREDPEAFERELLGFRGEQPAGKEGASGGG